MGIDIETETHTYRHTETERDSETETETQVFRKVGRGGMIHICTKARCAKWTQTVE